MAVLVIYSVLIVPVRVGFGVEAAKGGAWEFEVIVDFLFLFDVVVNFRSSYRYTLYRLPLSLALYRLPLSLALYRLPLSLALYRPAHRPTLSPTTTLIPTHPNPSQPVTPTPAHPRPWPYH